MGIDQDQVTGRLDEAQGGIEEVAGKLVGNRKLEAKGKLRKLAGKARAKLGDITKKVKDAL